MNSQLHIALIEDNADLRNLLALSLESLGHRVLAVESAEDFLEHRGGTNIDIHLIDLNLPGEDGLSLVRRIRQTSPGCGIVVLTARGQVNERVQGYECGADHYMVKPIALPELAAVLQRLTHRRTQELTLTSAPSIKLRKGLLVGSLGQIKLSFDESIMLEALIKAPAQNLATWQLASLLDAALDDAFRANLTVRLARLRKKLRSVGAEETALEPLRNHGYQLNTKIVLTDS